MTFAQCKVTTLRTFLALTMRVSEQNLTGIKSKISSLKSLQSVKSVTVLEQATFSPRRSQSLEPLQSGFQLFLSFSEFVFLLCKSVVLRFQIPDAFFCPL